MPTCSPFIHLYPYSKGLCRISFTPSISSDLISSNRRRYALSRYHPYGRFMRLHVTYPFCGWVDRRFLLFLLLGIGTFTHLVLIKPTKPAAMGSLPGRNFFRRRFFRRTFFRRNFFRRRFFRRSLFAGLFSPALFSPVSFRRSLFAGALEVRLRCS